MQGILSSRLKDHDNPFRKMVFDNQKEMEKVIGKPSENEFILERQEELATFMKDITSLMRRVNRHA
jgi:hypothetical protein